jgi:hypothetical protein
MGEKEVNHYGMGEKEVNHYGSTGTSVMNKYS